MGKISQISISICFFLLLGSCEKEASIEIDQAAPQMLVYSLFNADTANNTQRVEGYGLPETPIIRELELSQTPTLFGDDKKIFIPDATVWLSYAGDSALLAYDATANRYISPKKIFAENTTCTLTVKHATMGRFSVTEQVPQKVMLEGYKQNSLAVKDGGNSIGEVVFTFTDPVGENYYEVLYWAGTDYKETDIYESIFSDDPIITTETYYQHAILSKSVSRLVFSDKSFAGKQTQVRFNYNSCGMISDGVCIINRNIFKLKLRSISKAYYEFMSSYLAQTLARQNIDPLFGASVLPNLKSNIPTGLGIFGCYQESIMEVPVDYQIIDK